MDDENPNPMKLSDDELSDIHRKGWPHFDEAVARIRKEHEKHGKEQLGIWEGRRQRELGEAKTTGNTVGTLRDVATMIAAAHAMHPGSPQVTELARRVSDLTSPVVRKKMRRGALAEGIKAHMMRRMKTMGPRL